MSMGLLPVPRSGGIEVLELLGEMPGVDLLPEGPGEAATPEGELETCCIGMEPRSAAGGRSGEIGADARSDTVGDVLPDQTHQLIARGHLAAADARALGSRGGGLVLHDSCPPFRASSRKGADRPAISASARWTASPV